MRKPLLLACLIPWMCWSAPLPWQNPRAQEALSILSSSGLLQEDWLTYRAATRWEIAVLVQRLAEKVRSQPEIFASKIEREALQTLVLEVQDELQALGVRQDQLEEKATNLEARTEELERIRFRGQFTMSALYQGVSNTGNEFSGFGPNALHYAGLAGSSDLTNTVPHGVQGIIPQLDLFSGRPLIQGAGLTSTLYLEVETQPDDDWLYNLRVFAYSSQGNALVDAIWGTQQPYGANPFTGSGGGTLNGSNRAPFTSAGFDRFRLSHVPSGFTLNLGTFSPRLISSQVFTGQVNPRVGDPRLLECFGLQASADHGAFSWEILGSYLPDGNPPQLGLQPLQNVAWGGALTYEDNGFSGSLSFLQAQALSRDGAARGNGLSNLVNGDSGQVNVNWVNPDGFFAGQLSNSQSAGPGSTSDVRPISGPAALDGAGRLGGFGPQQQTSFGGQLGYRVQNWSLQAEYAHSTYRPNQNSSFSRSGNLWSLGGGLDIQPVQFQLDYRWTDPTYDPMILVFPSPSPGLTPFRAYHRFPDQDQFWHLYSLHDTDRFPHNRKGLWPSLKWKYQENCLLTVKGRLLEQVQTSLQDVRFRAGALGPGLPNQLVLGHSPGFFDAFFREYSPLSFDANMNPLEDQRGRVYAYSIDLHHHFEDSPFDLDAGYESHHFERASNLVAALGGSQNRVDLTHSIARLALNYKASDAWNYRLGYSLAHMRGHYDPFGVYNTFAIANNSTDFFNRDSLQHSPSLEATWRLDSQTRWDFGFTYYSTIDRVPQSVFPGAAAGPFATAHPFSYNAYRVETRLEMNF